MNDEKRMQILSDIRGCHTFLGIKEIVRRHWSALIETRPLSEDEASVAKGRLIHDAGFPEVVDVGEFGATVCYVETFGMNRGRFVTRRVSRLRTSLLTELLDAMRRLDGDVALAVKGGVQVTINDIAWLLCIPLRRQRDALGEAS